MSNETLALIKEKRKLRRQYSQMKDPAVKTRINQFQKQVKDDPRVESQASWEKFCNSISLETDSNESWHKIKNFLKPKQPESTVSNEANFMPSKKNFITGQSKV